MLRRLCLLSLTACAVAGCTSSTTSSTASPGSRVTCQPIYAAENEPPSEQKSASCFAQNLTFTGEVAGRVLIAETAPVCPGPLTRGDALPEPSLHLIAGGKLYTLSLQAATRFAPPETVVKAGAPDQPLPAVSLLLGSHAPGADIPWQATRGSVTYHRDGVSGSVDVDLMRNIQDALPVHLSGDWRCGRAAPPSSPTAAPSGPCADVAAPTPGPCIAEDITLSGTIAGHADHGIGSPQPCGDVNGNEYAVTLSFAIAGEPLTFHINMKRDSTSAQTPFPPGPYGATYSFLTIDTPAVVLSAGLARWQSTAGTFTIAADKHSGTADLDLSASATDMVHIAGSWRCAN